MTKTKFKKNVYKLLDQNKQILVFVRIPNSGNNRHYFFINNKTDFDNLIINSNTSDSITIFKTIKLLESGLVTKEFIKKVLISISKDRFKSELIILKDSYEGFKEKKYSQWDSVENISELEEVLLDSIGEHINLIKDPEFWDKLNTYHLYFPNKLGISKPGKAY